jgi:intracellular sulfur oxidation DsrE/DsrF family protein
MKKVIAMTIAALMTFGFTATSAMAANGYGKQKVVYHINYDNPNRQNGALRNIQNHINAVGAKNLDLRVIMHGKGYTLLQRADKDLKLQDKIIKLKDQGIKFEMCANTIRGKKLDKKHLFGLKDSDIVPSGVAEIAKLEAEGYAYVKP